MSTDWPGSSVGRVSHRVTKGTTPRIQDGGFAESGINFIKVESIGEDGRLMPEKFAHISDATDQLLQRSQLQESDILFT